EEQQAAVTQGRLDELCQGQIALGIDPVEVLDEHNSRLAPALRFDEAPQDAMKLPFRSGVAPRRRALGIGNTEEIEQQGKRCLELALEQQERAGDLPPRLAFAVALLDAKVVSQQLEKRDVGDQPAV